MGIEQLGPNTLATVIAVKPQELGLTRAPQDSQKRPGQVPASADVQTIQKAAQEIAQPGGSSLQFNIDAETDRVVVKITDSATGELLRQIPMEEMLALAKSLDQLQGLLLKTKA
ncbi:flagellar protein FlaG [Nitrosovibrio tenuis]|uniref:Flagellar protein FlaG n=1 Tax=Nitrosovibrio tenuis TaxID=1233 RepID=A0A1H7J6Q1_9PROT|nr:flagellar protein FlaG [Nitrosovibrio tenuis]SEK69660.1 flagellar protein FlaG [Nitrosovibrio tenuis]